MFTALLHNPALHHRLDCHSLSNNADQVIANAESDSTLTLVEILLSILLFAAFGAIFVFGNLMLGRLARPSQPNDQKAATYECGEPTIGTSWVQFDLRFYIIALVYLVFDVEVALFYPWAVTYGDATAIGQRLSVSAFTVRSAALIDMLFFFGVLMVGFAYLWRFGYLDWVRSSATTSLNGSPLQSTELSQSARIDPEVRIA